MTVTVNMNYVLYSGSQKFVDNFLSYVIDQCIKLDILYSTETIQTFLGQEPMTVKFEWADLPNSARSYWLEFDSQDALTEFVLRWS